MFFTINRKKMDVGSIIEIFLLIVTNLFRNQYSKTSYLIEEKSN